MRDLSWPGSSLSKVKSQSISIQANELYRRWAHLGSVLASPVTSWLLPIPSLKVSLYLQVGDNEKPPH